MRPGGQVVNQKVLPEGKEKGKKRRRKRRKLNNEKPCSMSFLSYFFVKKCFLVGMSGVCYGRVNG